MHSFLHVWRLIFIRLNPQLPGELIMPVIKLTQESISRLLCSEDKRCEQFCDSSMRGLCSKFAEPIPAVPHGMSGTRTMQPRQDTLAWASTLTYRWRRPGRC